MATITGTNGDDTLTGTSADDVINGGGGDDTINGNGGNESAVFCCADDIPQSGNDTVQDGTETDVRSALAISESRR